jgi:phage terminase small subunit
MKISTNPKPPGDLTPEGKQLWRRIYDEIDVDEPARLLLDTLCRQFCRMEEAREAIAKEGAVSKDRFGQYKPSPWVAIERDSSASMMRAWRLLGFDQIATGPMGRPPGR